MHVLHVVFMKTAPLVDDVPPNWHILLVHPISAVTNAIRKCASSLCPPIQYDCVGVWDKDLAFTRLAYFAAVSVCCCGKRGIEKMCHFGGTPKSGTASMHILRIDIYCDALSIPPLTTPFLLYIGTNCLPDWTIRSLPPRLQRIPREHVPRSQIRRTPQLIRQQGSNILIYPRNDSNCNSHNTLITLHESPTPSPIRRRTRH